MCEAEGGPGTTKWRTGEGESVGGEGRVVRRRWGVGLESRLVAWVTVRESGGWRWGVWFSLGLPARVPAIASESGNLK